MVRIPSMTGALNATRDGDGDSPEHDCTVSQAFFLLAYLLSQSKNSCPRAEGTSKATTERKS